MLFGIFYNYMKFKIFNLLKVSNKFHTKLLIKLFFIFNI